MNPNLNHPARKAYEQRVCEHFADVMFGDCTDDSFSDEFYRDEDQVAGRLDGCLANVPPAVLAPGAHAEDSLPTGGRHRRPDELDDSLDMALNLFAVAMMILAAAACATVVTVARPPGAGHLPDRLGRSLDCCPLPADPRHPWGPVMSVLSRTARPSRVRIKREDGYWWVLSPWQAADSRLSWHDALASAEVILRQRETVAKHPEHLADRVSDLVDWGWSFKQLREQTGIQLEDLVTLQHSPYSRCRELRIPKRQETRLIDL